MWTPFLFDIVGKLHFRWTLFVMHYRARVLLTNNGLYVLLRYPRSLRSFYSHFISLYHRFKLSLNTHTSSLT